MSRPVRVGIVGAGSMGTNHARVVGASASAALALVVDCDLERAERIAHPAGAVATTDPEPLRGCDAVIVACPTEYHCPVALDLLAHGVPLLVEKPLAATLDEAEAMVETAARHEVPLMCGFVERFNAAVVAAANLLDEVPLHIVSIRHSPPTPRITTSVIHDLLIHDIDLALRFLPGMQIEAVAGAAPLHPVTGTAEVADCTLRFAGQAMATLSASRASQRKIRSLMLTTPQTLVEVDLLRQDVTVYRNISQAQVGTTPSYRAETIVDIPFVRHAGEPLALQFEHLVRLVRGDLDVEAERQGLLDPHRVAAQIEPTASRAPEPVLEATR